MAVTIPDALESITEELLTISFRACGYRALEADPEVWQPQLLAELGDVETWIIQDLAPMIGALQNDTQLDIFSASLVVIGDSIAETYWYITKDDSVLLSEDDTFHALGVGGATPRTDAPPRARINDTSHERSAHARRIAGTFVSEDVYREHKALVDHIKELREALASGDSALLAEVYERRPTKAVLSEKAATTTEAVKTEFADKIELEKLLRDKAAAKLKTREAWYKFLSNSSAWKTIAVLVASMGVILWFTPNIASRYWRAATGAPEPICPFTKTPYASLIGGIGGLVLGWFGTKYVIGALGGKK